MAEYRAYSVGEDGHFIGFEPLVCVNDAEAIEKAGRLVVGHDVELWNGERFVKRLFSPNSPCGNAVTHEVRKGRMIPKPTR